MGQIGTLSTTLFFCYTATCIKLDVLNVVRLNVVAPFLWLLWRLNVNTLL
jgi:hypothetical protein